MATKDPVFAVAEPVRTLSDSLGLPEWLEPNRHAIEESLTPDDSKSNRITIHAATPGSSGENWR